MERYACVALFSWLMVSNLIAAQNVRPVVFPTDDLHDGPACTRKDGSPGRCLHHSLCASQLSGNLSDVSMCTLESQEPGICCPDESAPVEPTPVAIPKELPREPSDPLPPIQKEDLDKAGVAARARFDEILTLESELQAKGLVVVNGSKESLHRAFFKAGSPPLRVIGKNGIIATEATQELMKEFQLNNLQGRDRLPQLSLRTTVISDACPKKPPCPSTKYRTADGSCNNLQHSDWGKSFLPFERILPPEYADGVNQPRVAADLGPLPSARDVSAAVFPDSDRPNPVFTLAFMQWGQFLDHDLTLTGLSSADNGQGILCCSPEIQQNPNLRHPACFPVAISQQDPFYSRFGQSCMEFVRSLAAPTMECSFGPRQQLNQLTSFIDASNVYGSTEVEMGKLRSFIQGRLINSQLQNQEMLPIDPENGCFQEDQVCFKAGDARVNEQTSLAALHTIWLREHNRISALLSSFNPGWTDEILFQETRRIVGAMMQHITYNEYLPLVVGRRIMSSFKLQLLPQGYKDDYDPTLNPTITNVFATAAYRFGHSLVQGLVSMVEKDGSVTERIPLASQLFNPTLFSQEGYLDRFLRGLVFQSSQRFDPFVSQQLTNHLFEGPGETFGLDLVALNIQRGRDHGLPGYNKWRAVCGLEPATSFDHLAQFIHPEAAQRFRLLYRHVDDVDLFAGGLAEKPLKDATLGPVFACLVAEQFRRLRHGDRFWYENGGLESSFSPEQLTEIRKSNLARLLCDNTEGLEQIQPLAFIQTADWNPLVSCQSSQIPEMSFEPWMNEPVWA